MGAIEDAKTYGLTIRESATDGSDFTNPDADYRRLFLGEDGQLHVKDSAGAVTGIGEAAADILDLPTAEDDDTLVLAPDGTGGVEFRAETGGGGMTDPTSAVGDIIYRGDLAADLNIVQGVTLTGGPSGWTNLPYAIDNNDSTSASQGEFPPTDHWLKVDFGSAKTVVATRLLSTNGGPPNFTIESSTDDVNWDSRLVKTSTPQDTGVLTLSTPATAQYWRITANSQGNTYWGVGTWALFPPGALIALPVGVAPRVIGVTAGVPAWILQTVRSAAGVPSGAPTGTELPIAFDSTSSTGGLYFWSGSAWVKGSTIP